MANFVAQARAAMCQCGKRDMVVHARGGVDGRPLWHCLSTGSTWTSGNPYAEPGSHDRLMCLLNYIMWKARVGGIRWQRN